MQNSETNGDFQSKVTLQDFSVLYLLTCTFKFKKQNNNKTSLIISNKFISALLFTLDFLLDFF